ncbi:Six-bladed beta-propeller TolB-like protein [Apiospora rasikravindrae]|uniref:Six-bladed beta-propeller TolB-like protein n=1 Tax=Apiospora rasikravindrae TaxID=990691 RepID=A0ABR1U113_9PEZI
MRDVKAVTLATASLAAAQFTPTLSNPDLANFSVITSDFSAIIGQTPSIELIQNATEPLFHEAGVFLNGTLYVSSNRIKVASDPATADQTILLHAVTNVMSGDLASIALEPISTSQVVLPNGGTLYGSSGLVFTSQGSKTASGGLFVIPDPLGNPNTSVPLVTDFHGKPFNSLNDVAVNTKDGNSVWFTDPDYGHVQGVYRFDPATNSTRVVADGFSKPNGLAFDAEFRTLYVTDTGATEAPDGAGPASIYAFDIVGAENGPFLANRRVFAYAPKGIPDGVRVDNQGNVWSGIGSGLAVWNRAGTLIGQVLIEGGAANFGFAPNGTVFVLNETKLWRVRLAGQSVF